MTDLDQDRADLNALVRTAHEAIKDLTRLNREADEKYARLEELSNAMLNTIRGFEQKTIELANISIAGVIDEQMTPAVEDFLTRLGENIAAAQDAIYKRFDAVVEELTEGKGKVAWDNLSLPDYFTKKATDG